MCKQANLLEWQVIKLIYLLKLESGRNLLHFIRFMIYYLIQAILQVASEIYGELSKWS